MSKRRALIIGNSRFDEVKTFPHLRTPANDVQTVADVLEQYGRFDVVTTHIDQDSETLRGAIEELFTISERGDLALLYYSGHGYRTRDGQLCLVARNSMSSRVLSTAISESFIHDVVKQSACRHRIIILDCCHSGALLPGIKGADEEISLETLQGEGTVILTSSSRSQLSFEDDTYSLFTKHLLFGITSGQADENRDGKISAGELFYYVEKRVKQSRPDQTPALHISVRDAEIVVVWCIDQPRTTLFLIHSGTRKDRYFAAWLRAKLTLEGYKVCAHRLEQSNIDLHSIERILGRETAKVLFVASETSFREQQTRKELAIAAEISNRRGFVVSLAPSHWRKLPPEIVNEHVISFTDNWARGIKELLDLLKKAGVPKSNSGPDSEKMVQDWGLGVSAPTGVIKDVSERYTTNWFEIQLPEFLFEHTLVQLDTIDVSSIPYPAIKGKECLVTFVPADCLTRCSIQIQGTKTIETASLLRGDDIGGSDSDESVWIRRNYVVQLLNDAFSRFVESQGLLPYSLSQAKAFYFPKDTAKWPGDVKISLREYGKSWVQLTGKVKNRNWHFAVEASAFLYPLPAYFVTYHVVFTNQAGTPVASLLQHRLRRQVGKDWYNKKWRDMTLGAMLLLAGGRLQPLRIPISDMQSVEVSSHPVIFSSPVGYDEPTNEREH